MTTHLENHEGARLRWGPFPFPSRSHEQQRKQEVSFMIIERKLISYSIDVAWELRKSDQAEGIHIQDIKIKGMYQQLPAIDIHTENSRRNGTRISSR